MLKFGKIWRFWSWTGPNVQLRFTSLGARAGPLPPTAPTIITPERKTHSDALGQMSETKISIYFLRLNQNLILAGVAVTVLLI